MSERVKEATSQVIATRGSKECFEWCAPNTCLLVFMDVRGLLFLSMHSAPADLTGSLVQKTSHDQYSGSADLLDGPWGSDPAIYVIWSRFRHVRRYLAYWLRRTVHCPTHHLLDLAVEIGFSLDSEQEGWIRAGHPPLRMMAGPVQHFRSYLLSLARHCCC